MIGVATLKLAKNSTRQKKIEIDKKDVFTVRETGEEFECKKAKKKPSIESRKTL